MKDRIKVYLMLALVYWAIMLVLLGIALVIGALWR